jgi:hypothetical protein
MQLGLGVTKKAQDNSSQENKIYISQLHEDLSNSGEKSNPNMCFVTDFNLQLLMNTLLLSWLACLLNCWSVGSAGLLLTQEFLTDRILAENNNKTLL